MGENKHTVADQREPVKLSSSVVKKVRENKKKTGVPISIFFEKAAIEKLDKQKAKDDKV